MKFIKLTNLSGKQIPIFINMDKIKTFQPTDDGGVYKELAGGDNEDYIYVKETPEEILKLINKAENG